MTNAQEKLGCYVYALFDSGTPEWPFYIGKGAGNRVFSHVREEIAAETEVDLLSNKLQEIHAIKQAGRFVIQKIIRFRLSNDEALKIEASLIDLVNHIKPETLKNEISGHGVAEGFQDANDLATSLGAEELRSDLPLLIIKIDRLWTGLLTQYGSSHAIPNDAIYEATKGNWKLNVARAERADCVLAVARGLVRAVIVPTGWEVSSDAPRKQMTGQLTGTAYEDLVSTSVAYLFERGSQNPVRYLNC